MPRRAARITTLLLVALAAAGALPLEERARLVLDADDTTIAPGATGEIVAEVRIEPGWHVNSNQPTFEYLIPTTIAVALPAGWTPAVIRYPEAVMRTFSFETQPLAVYEGVTAIPIEFDVPAGAAGGAAALAVKLRYQACSDTLCLPPVETSAALELTIVSGSGPAPAGPATADPADGRAPRPAPVAEALTAPAGRGSLPWMLLLAFFGGLILNAMPCVLPVLSLKVFGLVQSAGGGRRHVTVGALGTSAGILVSFWALAAAAIAVRAAGGAVGWGVQFQNPAFVAFLGVVVVLFCLNLWGLFEVPLPSALARFAASGPSDGLPGHFASGLFATLMATPCSAPFLGTAVGFALAQPAPVVLAVFTAVAAGMALPYLLLALAPGAARLLPRPGAWMDQLKVVMGFLLAASAVWIFYVLAAQVPPDRLAFFQLALLLLALGAWVRQRNYANAGGRRLGTLLMAAAAALAIFLVRPPAAVAGSAATAAAVRPGAAAQLITWQPWDRAAAESLATAGRIVFVDVTAEWCFTCKVNERLILETPEVAAAFARHQVVAMKADWTNRDDDIARYLSDFGRAGIPFYALYRPGREPRVFAELLTKDGLLSELEAAAAGAPATAGAPAADGMPSR